MTDVKTNVLVVDDDELIRDVVVATLHDYGVDADSVATGAAALDRLEKGGVDLVLSDVRMPDMDGVALVKAIHARNPKMPILLMTGFEDVMVSLNATEIGASGIITKPCAGDVLVDQIRETMSAFRGTETLDEDFARVSIGDFVAGRMLPFHIYVRVAKNRFIRVADKGVDLDRTRLRAYQERGIQFLHLRKPDFKTYFKTNVNLMQRLDKNPRIPIEKKQRFLRHAGEVLLEHCHIIGLDDDAVAGAREFLIHSLDVISDDESFVDLLSLLSQHTDFVYAHSLAVSMVSTLIARELKWDSDATTFRLGLAGMLHDIGKKEIDRAILSKPRHLLTPEERAQVETHPHRGFKILQAMGTLPEEIIQAVLQHHEEPSGLGYPAKIRSVEITPMAQIVSLANIFCNYTIRNPSRPVTMSAPEAITQMAQFDAMRVTPIHFEALQSLCGVRTA